MTTFSVILEAVPSPRHPRKSWVEIIEADDLETAWIQARMKWYKSDMGPLDPHIADIKEGTVEIPQAGQPGQTVTQPSFTVKLVYPL